MLFPVKQQLGNLSSGICLPGGLLFVVLTLSAENSHIAAKLPWAQRHWYYSHGLPHAPPCRAEEVRETFEKFGELRWGAAAVA